MRNITTVTKDWELHCIWKIEYRHGSRSSRSECFVSLTVNCSKHSLTLFLFWMGLFSPSWIDLWIEMDWDCPSIRFKDRERIQSFTTVVMATTSTWSTTGKTEDSRLYVVHVMGASFILALNLQRLCSTEVASFTSLVTTTKATSLIREWLRFALLLLTGSSEAILHPILKSFLKKDAGNVSARPVLSQALG